MCKIQSTNRKKCGNIYMCVCGIQTMKGNNIFEVQTVKGRNKFEI